MEISNEERIQNKVDEIRLEFEKRIAKIQEEGSNQIQQVAGGSPDPNGLEAVLNATFDVEWKTTSIKFDIPKFSMERADLEFDVPEVKMELKTMKFDVPATRMVRTCLFKKPEITVKRLKVYTKMTCVYGDKPEVYMKTIEIKTDIPKFSSKRMKISFDKPVVRMETTEIKLKLPQFYFRELSGELKKQQREIEDVGHLMSSEISKAESEMKLSLDLEIASELEKINSEVRDSLIKERKNISTFYDDAISKSKSSIKILKENNAVDEVKKMEDELAILVTDYQKVLDEIDNALKSISFNLVEVED